MRNPVIDLLDTMHDVQSASQKALIFLDFMLLINSLNLGCFLVHFTTCVVHRRVVSLGNARTGSIVAQQNRCLVFS